MKKSKNIKETFKNLFLFRNINQLPSGIRKITISSILNKDISLKNITKISALLEILTSQKSYFLRAKNSNISLKRKKGFPIGAKVTLRKDYALAFYFVLLCEIFPQFKESNITFNLKKNAKFRDSFSLNINDPLLFQELKNFYFLFKDICALKITCNFSGLKNLNETYFNSWYFKVPLKIKS